MISGTWIQTDDGPRQVGELIDKPFKAVIDGKYYAATGFRKTGNNRVFKVLTDRGYELRVTDTNKLQVEIGRKRRFKRVDGRMKQVGFYVKTEWIDLQALQPGGALVLANHIDCPQWDGYGSFDEGWLVGSIVGDGGYNPDKYSAYLRFWGDQNYRMADHALELVKMLPFEGSRPIDLSVPRAESNGHITVSSRALDQLVHGLIEPRSKASQPELERTSAQFHRGFLRGLFDADGSVQGELEKGVSVRLSQSNLDRLKVAQRMLARLGIISTNFENRRDSHARELPDGKGGLQLYECKAQHELVISRSNLVPFMEQIGFLDENKARRLSAVVLERKRGHYAERFTAKVMSIEEDGIEAVYECTVDVVHCFDANGVVARSCGEIDHTGILKDINNTAR